MRVEQLTKRFQLTGKKALITDIACGPAQEVAVLLADAGAEVVIANPEQAMAQGLAETICANGGNACAVPCDLLDEISIKALIEKVVDSHNGIDILVNCAALTLNYPFVETSLAQLDTQFALNLRSPFLLMRETVRQMVAQGRGGRIINISTIGAQHPVLEGNAIYSASRAALNMMSRNVALDHLSDGILVNCVLPGAFRDKVVMHEDSLSRVRAGHSISGPIMQPGRMGLGYGDPQDIATAVLYLAGPSGGFITGQNITLDGGFLLT